MKIICRLGELIDIKILTYGMGIVGALPSVLKHGKSGLVKATLTPLLYHRNHLRSFVLKSHRSFWLQVGQVRSIRQDARGPKGYEEITNMRITNMRFGEGQPLFSYPSFAYLPGRLCITYCVMRSTTCFECFALVA